MIDYPALKDLALDIAPELRQSPLYIIGHPAELPTPTATAYASHGQNAALQDHLERAGLWEGPGPTIAFVNQDIGHQESLAVLVHELAHILPYAPPPEPLTVEPLVLAEHYSAFKSWIDQTAPEDKPGWAYGGHGKEFIRIALHLWWRAALRGEFVFPEDVYFSPRYDVSSIGLYWRMLGGEGVKMQDATFAEILATTPPQDFTNLFDADLAIWMKANPEAVQKVKAAQ